MTVDEAYRVLAEALGSLPVDGDSAARRATKWNKDEHVRCKRSGIKRNGTSNEME